MFKDFSADGDTGTLKPLHRGLFLNLPSWVALLFAIPLLLLFAITLIFQAGLILPLFLGTSAALFLALWHFSRNASKRVGLIHICRKTGDVSVVQKDGSEQISHLGSFCRIRINKVRSIQGYVWWAFLEGERAELPLSVGFTFSRLLIRKLSPVAEWLRIPIEQSNSDMEVDMVATFRENKTVVKGS